MIEHGTPEWEAARLGKLTASRCHDALATLKSGNWAGTRRKYMIELVSERLTGMRADPKECWASIVGVGPSFPAISGMGWVATCDELPPSNDLVLPDIRDIVAARARSSLMIAVEGDLEDLEALNGR